MRPYFATGTRPVSRGDLIAVRAAMATVEFKVTDVVPDPCCYVGSTTDVVYNSKPVKRAVSSTRSSRFPRHSLFAKARFPLPELTARVNGSS